MKYDIALLGLGVMGQSLARNIASREFHTAVYNRTASKTDDFIEKFGTEYLHPEKDLKTLVENLSVPRKIILMVPAGRPVDAMLEQLSPLLEKGDIVIDAGNSLYTESIRRTIEMEAKDIRFVGMGVSGGEEGALRGPSIMPGGTKEAWTELKPILEAIAAKDFNDGPCVTHIGNDGAGHYVKMVHNGIEYGVMQMMAEAYAILKNVYSLEPPQIAEIFEKFNKGKLRSYLFEITVPILKRKDEFNDGYLIDFILDKAGQKGTGRWVAIDALERGVVLPTITEAVYARSVSAFKDKRVELSKTFDKPKAEASISLEEFVSSLEGALYAGMISSYAQGFELMRTAAEEQKWNLDFAEISRIWEGGCIIRADLLNFLHKAFNSAKGNNVHLFEIPEVKEAMESNLDDWRNVVSYGIKNGVPLPGLSTALVYFESMTSEVLPANFIQGQRDFFGAHTYERTDREGVFHTPWSNLEL